MWTPKRQHDEATLDLTPLVDVVFLIIIFFMLSTTFIVLPGIEIELPRASSEKVELEKEEIVLTVDKAGHIYIDDRSVTPEALRAHLTMTHRIDPIRLVVLKGDRGADYGRVIDVLSQIRDCGLNRIAIITKEGDDGKMEREGEP